MGGIGPMKFPCSFRCITFARCVSMMGDYPYHYIEARQVANKCPELFEWVLVEKEAWHRGFCGFGPFIKKTKEVSYIKLDKVVDYFNHQYEMRNGVRHEGRPHSMP